MATSDQETQIFDAIDGLAPPHKQTAFFGHEQAETAFLSAWQSEKMHHAWLLTGPRGIGKATFAFRAARFLFKEGEGAYDGLMGSMAPSSMDVDPQSSVARLVDNLAHPNLLVINRPYDEKTKKFRTEITVDEVRRTVPFFGSTAGERTWRVCIVDPADDLNANAANALLKILEEPPQRTIFFLISHAPGRLLPTIRSRCRRLSFAPLEKPVLNHAIPALGIAEGDKVKDLVTECEGSLRKAAELLSDDGLVLAGAFERLLKPPYYPDYESLHAFGDIVSQRGKEQRFAGFADLVHRYLSEKLHEMRMKDGVEARNLYPLAEAWDTTNDMIRQTSVFNLDKKQTTIEVMRLLAKASRGG